MIKGRKIESNSIIIAIPLRKNQKNNTQDEAAITLAASQPSHNSQNKHEDDRKQQKILKYKNESENHQQIVNKDIIIEQDHKDELKKTLDIKISKKEPTKISQLQLSSSSKHPKIISSTIQNQFISKPSKNKIYQTKNSNNQILKNKKKEILKRQEKPQNGYHTNKIKPQSAYDVKSMNIQGDVKVQQPFMNIVASDLIQQQHIPSSSQDQFQQLQRQKYPNPIEDVPTQQQLFALHYQDDSYSEEEAYSFRQGTQHLKSPYGSLPINMELFQLSADQLMALDFFPI